MHHIVLLDTWLTKGTDLSLTFPYELRTQTMYPEYPFQSPTY